MLEDDAAVLLSLDLMSDLNLFQAVLLLSSEPPLFLGTNPFGQTLPVTS